MEDEIIAIESAIRNAQLTNDTDYFERILADNFQFITPQGKLITKQQDIAPYLSGDLKITRAEISEQSIQLFGTTAIVRFIAEFGGQAGKYSFATKARLTRVYSKHTGSWQMIAGHSTEMSA